VNWVEPTFTVLAATQANGDCPFHEFLESERNPKDRAAILGKVDHVSRLSPREYQRPLIDTLDGPIKRIKVDQQLRVLFSSERQHNILLIYGGGRKKNGSVDPALIRAAQEMRAAWLAGREARPVPIATLLIAIKRKKIRWPHEEEQ
jgi:hypothetical protein